MKSLKLIELAEEALAKEDPHVKVYDRGSNSSDRYTISIHHPQKGHKVYTMSTDSFKHKKASMFFHSTKKVSADKTWGKEVPIHKLPDEVHQEIHKLKVAEGLAQEEKPNDKS
jgi:hypothetical protein